MNNLSSYCGLVDAEIRASEKDLPVQKKTYAPPFPSMNFSMSKFQVRTYLNCLRITMQGRQQFSILFRFTINQQVACFYNLWKARQCFCSTCTDLTKSFLFDWLAMLTKLLTVTVCLLWFLSGKNPKIYSCSFYNNTLLLERSAELSHQLWTCCLSFCLNSFWVKLFSTNDITQFLSFSKIDCKVKGEVKNILMTFVGSYH